MTKEIFSKILSVLLGFSLLCSMASGAVLYSRAAETTDESFETFSVDFAELAEKVTAAQWNGSTGYIPEENDVHISNWVNERFGMYFSRETHTFAVRNYLGEPSTNYEGVDPYGGGYHYWKIDQNGQLVHVTTEASIKMLRKGDALWVKEDGVAAQLKNFEATLVFNTASNLLGSVYIAFHEETPGKFGWDVNAANPSDTTPRHQDAVIIGQGDNGSGITIKKYNETVDAMNVAEVFDTALTAYTLYALQVKVEGTTVYVKLTTADGAATIYEKTVENACSDRIGSISFGTTNDSRCFKSIEIKELDDAGKQVDFGTGTIIDFDADFTQLTTLDAGSWIYDKFGATQTVGTTYTSRTALGTWVNNVFWSINSGDYGMNVLRFTDANWPVGQTLHVMESLYLKKDGEAVKIKNFEANLVFNNRIYEAGKCGSVYMSFHEEKAGNFGYSSTANGASSVNNDAVIASYGTNGQGITVRKYGENISNSEVETQVNGGALISDWMKLYVRVLNGELTVKLTSEDGKTTYYEATMEDAVSNQVGYFSIGVSGFYRDIKSLNVVELDDAGNVVDLGTGDITAFDADFTQLTTLEEGSWIYDKFGAAQTCGDVYTDRELLNENINSCYWIISNDNYIPRLRFTDAAFSGNMLRVMDSLYLKQNEEAASLKNFEATVVFSQLETGIGSFWVSFHEEKAGCFGWSSTDNGASAVNNDAVLVGYGSNGQGITVRKHGEDIDNTALDTVINQGAWIGGFIKLYVRVVNGDLTVKLTSEDGLNTYYEATEENAVSDQSGYFSVGASRYYRDIRSIQVVQLDDAGNAMDFGSDVVESAVSLNGKIITVSPAEGYELKAGSLIVTDAYGKEFVPTRVGFREGGTAEYYQISSDAVAPYKIAYKFIRPSLDNVNIGNIGTSINTEQVGLRFVSRFTRVVENDTEYIVLDGEKYPVKDYGMLIGLQSVIGNDTLDIALTESNSYVKRISVVHTGIYYDYCDEYIDMSVCVTNMDRVQDGLSKVVVSRGYMILDDGTAQGKVVYSDAFSGNYEQSALIETVSFAELFGENQIIRHGRAGMVGSEYQMDWTNTGFEISGELSGALKLKTVSTRADSLLNVIVDDNDPVVVHVPNGDTTVTLVSELTKGYHTVKVISGTSPRQGNLSAIALQYTGTLDTLEEDNTKLRITMLGDSITCGWGLGGVLVGDAASDRTQQVAVSNAYQSYATITAENLDAYLDVVALCAQSIREIHGYSANLNFRAGKTWDWASNQQDIIVVNLGTNDELRGEFTADTALADAKALLEDMRAKNPNAYIIYVYGMICKNYEASYKAAVQYMADKGDDKVLILEMDPNTAGHEAHPGAAAHTEYAEKLTAFIKENCADLFKTATTSTVSELMENDTVLLHGRAALDENNALNCGYSNTGVTLSGYMYGDMKLNITAGSSVRLNVVIDGDTDNVQTMVVPAGTQEVTVAKNLRRGEHTVEITRGTNIAYATLKFNSVTYFGTLTTPTAPTLQIEFMGDSITCGEGNISGADAGYTVNGHNSYSTYAAQTARDLDAGLSVVAVGGAKTADLNSMFNDSAWDFANTQKDIVVINLGTNDVGAPQLDIEAAEAGGLRDAATALIESAREKYGDDVYVIWAYGMMFPRGNYIFEEVVEAYKAENPDANVFFCDLSSAQNTAGYGAHPNQDGHDAAAALLTAFIRENCEDIL